MESAATPSIVYTACVCSSIELQLGIHAATINLLIQQWTHTLAAKVIVCITVVATYMIVSCFLFTTSFLIHICKIHI